MLIKNKKYDIVSRKYDMILEDLLHNEMLYNEPINDIVPYVIGYIPMIDITLGDNATTYITAYVNVVDTAIVTQNPVIYAPYIQDGIIESAYKNKVMMYYVEKIALLVEKVKQLIHNNEIDKDKILNKIYYIYKLNRIKYEHLPRYMQVYHILLDIVNQNLLINNIQY